MNRVIKILRGKDVGAIGIGAMIVFIAMVLVAGIAASVLIQTSSTIQLQAMSTGQQTTKEVSSGIEVYDIEGKLNVTNGTKYDLKYLAIGVKARPGADGMDLNNTYVLLSDGEKKALLRYGGYNDVDLFVASPSGDLFGVLSDADWNKTDRETFAIAVIQDYDGSIKQATPTLNRGDKAIILIRCSPLLNGTFGREIPERVQVTGQVLPEVGSPGVIHFTTPMSYFDEIYDLQ
ncbi:archaeal flagellin [Thermoplasmatales archaeon SCGC AB-540-F20]|nr:archaeal flagellin [Thermoplasmatales archaeon SCGC AB-540-F20]